LFFFASVLLLYLHQQKQVQHAVERGKLASKQAPDKACQSLG